MAIRINEVKSAWLSDDQKEVIVDCSGRYTGALELRFSRDCFDQMLQALMPPKGATVAPAAEALPAAPAASAPAAEALPSAKASALDQEALPVNPDEVKVEVPKNAAVTADPGRGYVILILNHRLPNQAGYALTPDAADNVADGLTKSSTAMRAAKSKAQQAT